MGIVRIISHSNQPFRTRKEASLLLAGQLDLWRNKNILVLGIPRGGVAIAKQLAHLLEADLDIILSHKLGAPGNPELAIGSVSEKGKLFLDQAILAHVTADDDYIQKEKNRRLNEIKRRARLYRSLLPKIPIKDRTLIITDDGAATGSTMQAALSSARLENPQKIIAALPVGPEDTIQRLAEYTDEIICLRCPPFFSAISQFYLNFEQVDDQQLLDILENESKRKAAI